MKKMIIAGLLFSASVSQAYIYFQNPMYCRASWDCEVLSTNFKETAKICNREAFARTVATVYQEQNGKMQFKGYGCYDPLYAGGGE